MANTWIYFRYQATTENEKRNHDFSIRFRERTADTKREI